MGKKTKEKIYKAGTKIKFYQSCAYAGCDSIEVETLPSDMTESELNDQANEMALEVIQPEGWFELAGNGDDDE